MANEYTTITVDMTKINGDTENGTLTVYWYRPITLANGDTIAAKPQGQAFTVTAGAASIQLAATDTAILNQDMTYLVKYTDADNKTTILGTIQVVTSSDTVDLADLLGASTVTSERYRFAYNWRGTWDEDAAYAKDDLVYYNGSTFKALGYNVGQQPADLTAYWELFAKKGDMGTDGPLLYADIAALEAATGHTTGDIGIVTEQGIFRLNTASTEYADGLFYVESADGGNWELQAPAAAVLRPEVFEEAPVTKLVQCTATAESAHVFTYDYTKINGDAGIISSSLVLSWLALLSGSPYIDVRVPFGVVIGDSIAEGHSSLHGRLHPAGVGGFDPAYVNASGQLSYELGQIYGMYFYNHGIGSQTTTDVWTRWRRDVLAETYDPDDGRGEGPTLSAKPYVVFINIGVNDVSLGTATNTIKQNLMNMAVSARDNGILCVFNVIGAWTAGTASQIVTVKALNAWMKAELPRYGAQVVDHYAWSESDSSPDDARTDLYSDGLHPNRAGYKALARFMASQVTLPLYFQGLSLDSSRDPASPPSNYSRPKRVTATNGTFARTVVLTNEEQQTLAFVPQGDSDTIRLAIATDAYLISGTGIHTGWCRVDAILSRTPARKEEITHDQARISYGTAVPSSGTYELGAVHLNTAPNLGEPFGWICTTAGTPGTWRAMGYIPGYRYITAGYNVTDADETLLVSAAGAVTLTLPQTHSAGKRYTIKDYAGVAAANNRTVDAFGSQTIDGSANYVINTDYGFVTVVSDGSNWFRVG